MKNYKLLIIFSTLVMALTGCNGKGKESESQKESESLSESTISEETNEHLYNIIFTAATIPPVVSALESIKNGAKTYAYIERGKTYAGIALLEDYDFYNLGFDPTANLATGVTSDAFSAVINKVKELKQADPEATFNLFTTDYKPWAAVKVASDAKLSTDDFTVYMVEDGTATYDYAKKYFVTPFKNNTEADTYYDECVTTSYNLFTEGMKNSQSIDKMKNGYVECYPNVFALASHPNFVHVMQDKTKMEASLKAIEGSKLYKAYMEENGSNVIYKSISQRVAELDETQKNNYLNLMFGQYKDESYRLLTRTKRDNGDEAVPNKKLIYIGTRAGQSNKNLIPSQIFTNLSEDFSQLSNALREFFLLEQDYQFVREYLNNEANYEDAWKDNAEVVKAVKNAAFNVYIGFAYNLKLTQRLYGNKYDVLFKGHPGETFESPESWKIYKVTVDGVEYTYNSFMYKLARKFHTDDSEGKFIGVLPAGIAAENLAYLGVNTYVCGLPSSTYTGYDKASPILFVLNTIDEDIHSDGNIIQRYLDGELVWNDDGETIETKFFNKGLIYKTLAAYYNTITFDQSVYHAIANSYSTKFHNWLVSYIEIDDVDGCDVDYNGSVVLSESALPLARTVRINKIDAFIASINLDEYSTDNQTLIASLADSAKEDIGTLTNVYLMNKVVSDLATAVGEIEKLS